MCTRDRSCCADIAIFRILKTAAAAIFFDFWNREIILFIGVRRWRLISVPNFVNIVQTVAKILRFFNFSVGFVWGIFGLPTVSTWGSLSSAKFGYVRRHSFFIIYFNIWHVWLENAYSHPKNWGFGAFWSPKWAAISTKAKKAHCCVSPRHMSH